MPVDELVVDGRSQEFSTAVLNGLSGRWFYGIQQGDPCRLEDRLREMEEVLEVIMHMISLWDPSDHPCITEQAQREGWMGEPESRVMLSIVILSRGFALSLSHHDASLVPPERIFPPLGKDWIETDLFVRFAGGGSVSDYAKQNL
jgi:hypothetical protein